MSNSGAPNRQVLGGYAAFRTLEGDGFEVRRALPSAHAEAIGPLIFLDHFGPITVGPGQALGASAHPHTGIETLSLLLEGRFEHKDSLGNHSAMGPGDVQWMRAGRGIVHDEGPDADFKATGGTIHGIQLWLNMPSGTKLDAPAYRHFGQAEIPVLAGDGARARLVAGQAGGQVGPLLTHGNPLVIHASLRDRGSLAFDVPDARELAAYVMTGEVAFDGGEPVAAGHLVVLSPRGAIQMAASGAAEILLMGGDPLDAPIVRHGPFVTNSAEEMQQAIRRYQAGEMGRITV